MKKLLFVALLLSTAASFAEQEFTLVIRGHVFAPSEVKIPAGKKIALMVENQDLTVEEFESYDLNREKIIPPKSKETIFVGPLPPGRYPFFGEFHDKTARGVLITE